MKPKSHVLNSEAQEKILQILESRFEQNSKRHPGLIWQNLKSKLEKMPEKLWSLNEMEVTGGEPDVVEYNESEDVYLFIDCSKESPAGRRSCCYDREALDARKKHKPALNAVDFAEELGIEILTEEQYRKYHHLVKFDSKTSSWIFTPKKIRDLGGALFCDYRYETIFTYHNGADSYYAARGFRGLLKV